MSDLYLVLRRRLDDVTEWVELDTSLLRDARKARGFSYEAMGRQLNVAAKTWERWEKSGRVPRYELRRVAELLDLEIDWPKRTTVSIPDDATPEAAADDRQDRLEELLVQVLGIVRELRDELVAQREAPRARRTRSAPAK